MQFGCGRHDEVNLPGAAVLPALGEHLLHLPGAVVGTVVDRNPRRWTHAPAPGTDRGWCAGGGGDLSPWQGCDEWLLLLSATRSEFDMFTAVRPVAPVPTGSTVAPESMAVMKA